LAKNKQQFGKKKTNLANKVLAKQQFGKKQKQKRKFTAAKIKTNQRKSNLVKNRQTTKQEKRQIHFPPHLFHTSNTSSRPDGGAIWQKTNQKKTQIHEPTTTSTCLLLQAIVKAESQSPLLTATYKQTNTVSDKSEGFFVDSMAVGVWKENAYETDERAHFPFLLQKRVFFEKHKDFGGGRN
jgi:hypothetical protein